MADTGSVSNEMINDTAYNNDTVISNDTVNVSEQETSKPQGLEEFEEMYVTKRDGKQEIVSFDKILTRIKKLGKEANIKINYTTLVMKVIDQLYNGISTTKIDELSAEQCASMASIHPDYNILAGRIIVSNHHKNTSNSFTEVMTALYQYKDKHNKSSPLISESLMMTVLANPETFETICDYSRDYLIDYFGFKTLERAYLMKVNKVTIERPQHMWLRVAIGIHGDNLPRVRETYKYMSQKYFTHATPTLFNAGTPHPQLSSCFLLAMENDSIDGIYNTLKDCAIISKWAGGIGLHVHNIRAAGSHIRGTNGSSNGLVPMLKVFNNTAKYVDQCLDPETVVYTKRGPIKIRNIIIGDEVVCDDGRYYSIGKVLDNQYDGEFYILDVENTYAPLRLTDMHPLWTIKFNETNTAADFANIINQLDRNLLVPEFVEVKNIDAGDFIGFPIPTYEKDIPQYTEDDCRLYGILLGSGAISCTDGEVYVDLLTSENAETMEFIETYLRDINIPLKLERIPRNPHNSSKLSSDVRLHWTRTNMFKFTCEMLYSDSGEIHMMPSMLHLPLPKHRQLVKGILESCGIIVKHRVRLEIPSNNLAENVRYVLLRLGILTSGNLTVKDTSIEMPYGKGGVFWMPITQTICDLFPKFDMNPSPSTTYFEYKGVLYSVVRKNQLIPKYEGRVIDIEVDHEDHHNFLTHNGLVKNGGGKRNGSFAIYLEPWHADIEMFLQMRKNHGDEELKARDLFYALWISDLFMERVKADGPWTLMCPDECPGLADVYGEEFTALYTKYEKTGRGRKTMKARDLWFQILDAQMETGTPYILYKDACNKKSNQKNIGTIKSSNLCVAPETTILTDKGHIEIQELAGQTVNVWNGEEFSNVEVFQTGTDQELLEVETDDGSKLSCTPYHKFFIQKTYNKKSVEVVEAKDLKEGDKIIKCKYPVIDGTTKMNYAYTHGFFCGDGTYSNNHLEEATCKFKSAEGHYFCKRHIDFETTHFMEQIGTDDTTLNKTHCNANSYVKKPLTYLYGEKKQLLEYMETRGSYENGNHTVLMLPLDIEEKFYVPMTATLQSKLDWFAGYCDADGTIAVNQGNKQLQIALINYDFLVKTKLMLQTCGINPKVRLAKQAGRSILPDGHGGQKEYVTQPVYRLLITSVDLENIVQLGFAPKRLQVQSTVKPNRAATNFIKIQSVTNNGRRDATYCFTEPKRHAGIFNGILTSQCTEILEVSTPEETAVCNLASIALPTFINTKTSPPTFGYNMLHVITKIVTYNLNKVIDVNYYPTPKTKLSNMRHRPIGLGVQGLADVFMLMGLPFGSPEAKLINKRIFETIYHAALEESSNLAFKEGAYETFAGSPASEGKLQFDLWSVDAESPESAEWHNSCEWYIKNDWKSLKAKIQSHGLRNSLLVAPMPTASTSQILGFNECIEPITSNIYNRRTIAGEFILANKYLMYDLIKLDLWNEQVKNSIIANHGSVQHLEIIPVEIREKYKTVWEIPMRTLIDMAADRGAYICQSQSLNLWLEDPNYSTLTAMHFYSWSKGLKTGIYYLRRRGRHQAQQFTIEPEKKGGNKKTTEIVEEEICEMCSA